MNKQTLIFIIFLGLMTTLLGFNYFVRPFEKFKARFISPQVTENFDVVEELSPEEKILSGLTTKEKIAQLIALPVDLDKLPTDNGLAATASDSAKNIASGSGEIGNDKQELAVDAKTWIKINHPGFITIFGNNISQKQLKLFESEISPSTSFGTEDSGSKIKIYLAVDHEGGSVQRLSGADFTALPSWQEFCQLEDKTERANLLASSSAELSAAGIDIVLAPMADIGPNKILKNRICADDPEIITQRAAEYIYAFTDRGILPVLKHFPGIGDTNKDLHQQFDQIVVKEDDMLIYKSLLEKFPQIAAMISHVGVKNQYADIPCSLSGVCVEELTDNYPEVLVFSDALEMKSALYDKDSNNLKSLSQVSSEAVVAGVNVLLYGPGVETQELDKILQALEEKYDADEHFRARVDSSVLKIIELKNQKSIIKNQ